MSTKMTPNTFNGSDIEYFVHALLNRIYMYSDK